MTRQEAEQLGYEVKTRLIASEGTPPRVAVVTLERGSTESPWVSVEQTLPGPGLESLDDVLDDLVARINEPVPPEPEPQPPRDRIAELESRIEILEGIVNP